MVAPSFLAQVRLGVAAVLMMTPGLTWAYTCDMADIDRDGVIGFDDFFALVDRFGEACDYGLTTPCGLADIDRDGTVGLDDFFLLADEFGRLCTGGDADGPCIDSGDHTSIQSALDGPGAEAVLCPGATFDLRETILFTADDQQIHTRGFPTDQTRAFLKIVGNSETAVAAGNHSGVKLKNVIIDGNRPQLGTAPGALIEFGSTGSGNVVEWVKAYEPRGWSVLYLGEGDDRRCQRAIARRNELGPAGQPHFGVADGISLGCPNSIVEYNTIVDVTDGGIVVFQAPGSLIAHNTIRTRERIMFYGISMEDYGPWDGDFKGTRVVANTIDAAGELIRRGISMGPHVGCIPAVEASLRSRGAVVRDNVLTGDQMGYGFVASGVENWTVVGNADQSTHRLPAAEQDCFGRVVDPPAGFQRIGATTGGTFQEEYREAVLGFTASWWPAEAVFDPDCMADLVGEDAFEEIRSGNQGALWSALEAADNAHLFDRCASLYRPPDTAGLSGEVVVAIEACEPLCAQVSFTNIAADEPADLRRARLWLEGFIVPCALPDSLPAGERAQCTVADFVTPGFQVIRWYGVPHRGADNGWGFQYPFGES